MMRNGENKEKERQIAIDRSIILFCESQDRYTKRKTQKREREATEMKSLAAARSYLILISLSSLMLSLKRNHA